MSEGFRKVGSVLKPHGLAGEFVVFLESDFPDWLARRSEFFVESGAEMVSWRVEQARFKGDRLLLKVDAVQSREGVDALRGTGLFVAEADARDAIDHDDYFFNSDLVGLEVVDYVDGDLYGKVVAVLEMPAQNLLEVERPGGKRFLFPFVKALVKEVLQDSRKILVVMPEGLMDCNS